MSTLQVHSHLTPDLPQSSLSSLMSISQQKEQEEQLPRAPSPDSSGKQLAHSVDKLLRRQKSIQVNPVLPEPELFRPSSSNLSTSPHSVSTLGDSSHWSNLIRLPDTFWWQRAKVSSFPSDAHLHHQLDSRANVLSAVTMASTASLYSPHLRRLLLPFTSTASVSSLRGERGHRRHRTTFTHGQTLRLEMEYQISEYISRSKRFQLAELLDLTESQIKIWFQNRRAKDKRIEKALNEQQIKQLLPLPNLVAKNVPSSVSSFERASFMGPKAILDPRKE